MCRARTLDGPGRAASPGSSACFEAGALATGATVDYTELSPAYSHMEPDPALLAAFRATPRRSGAGSPPTTTGAPRPTISTDMANVSLAVPTIHPLLGIETHGAGEPPARVRRGLRRPLGRPRRRDGALAMAWTAIDAASSPALRDRLLAGARRAGPEAAASAAGLVDPEHAAEHVGHLAQRGHRA